MVTLILIFLFVSPHYIDFKDRPVETVALHGSEVLVKEAGHDGTSSIFVFQIRSDQAGGPTASQSDDDRDAAILRIGRADLRRGDAGALRAGAGRTRQSRRIQRVGGALMRPSTLAWSYLRLADSCRASVWPMLRPSQIA